MSERILEDGPDGYFSETEPPSRGQYRAIAVAALRLLGVDEPTSRLEASSALVRIRLAIKNGEDVPEVPEL